MLVLPQLGKYTEPRILGDRVVDTAHITHLSALARIIVQEVDLQFRSTVSTPERFGINAWVYGERVLDLEIAGFRDAELNDPDFLHVTRQEFIDFVDRFNWINLDDERDQRFQGAVFLCNEREQSIRHHFGRVRIYRSWRRHLGRRYQPFLPLARGWL
ncbi:hypothetical protein SAMN04489729_0828 [Amycolatopsis lurida]|uniref:Uncharacterized protein n=1 Tax=Amycolatopsis lurida NRRL 2430 TaxID=1460371 RepID=A0A2P2FM40_AMYLU|nr:hypothetical protein [Amycolatopsis lurida]KFU77779.1 hypothetical protein BB31_29375 [Amycolatopsis lurida NRRL 2430]SEB39024.1 hypothetical protein SAMN04489729_0828 [Amycolatopsis lurida]